MEKDIIEGNFLIAKFLGAEIKDDWCFLYKAIQIDNCRLSELKFHTSWDWLMPVVEKIREVSFELWDSNKVDEKIWLKVDIWSGEAIWVDEETGEYPICNPIVSKTEPFINVMWQAVIQFITWYNSNPHLNP